MSELTTADRAAEGFDHHDQHLAGELLYDRYDELRAHCPVAFSERYGGFYTLTRYDDVRAVALDSEHFSSGAGILIPEQSRPPFRALEFDPPEHTWHRAVMLELLSPARVAQFTPMIREHAVALLDAVGERGECEVLADFAEPLAVNVITDVVGITGDARMQVRELTLEWVRQAEAPGGEEAMAAYLGAMIEQVQERRSNPRDDGLTHLCRAEIDGHHLSDEDVATFLITLTLGGHHSSVATLASIAFVMASRAETRDALLDRPELVPVAIEEVLRLYSPLHAIGRKTTEPAEVGGCRFAAGDRVMMNFGAANRDPAVFDQPGEFVLGRSNAARHMAFGYGIHKCVGMHMARAELRVAIEEILRRMPSLRLAGEVPFSHLQGGFLFGPTAVPVAFTPWDPEQSAATSENV